MIMDKFWLIPIMAFVVVGMVLVIAADGRANTPERYIEPPVIIPKKVSNQNPYVEFCSTEPLNPPFWPDKLIQNDTHKFNHEFCIWEDRK